MKPKITTFGLIGLLTLNAIAQSDPMNKDLEASTAPENSEIILDLEPQEPEYQERAAEQPVIPEENLEIPLIGGTDPRAPQQLPVDNGQVNLPANPPQQPGFGPEQKIVPGFQPTFPSQPTATRQPTVPGMPVIPGQPEITGQPNVSGLTQPGIPGQPLEPGQEGGITQQQREEATRHLMLEEEEAPQDGYWVRDAPLNEILQYLARKAHAQYIYNPKLETSKVTGHIYDGNPLKQMEQISFLSQVTIYRKDNTLYALTDEDKSKLPLARTSYQLRYLRASDESIFNEILKPALGDRGLMKLEPKTGTIVLQATETDLAEALKLLKTIDKAQGQVIVKTQIIRTNDNNAKRTGFDWAATLGDAGISTTGVVSLSSLFGLPSYNLAIDGTDTSGADNTGTGGGGGGGGGGGTAQPWSGNDTDTGLVLSPFQTNVVFRALATNDLGEQVSSPTIVTEDNEEAKLYIIDRIPIITQSNTASLGGTSSGNDVRYKIDESDPTGDPETSREIGISLVVTPTILSDNTIRLRMKPRIASIVGFEEDQLTGQQFPRVNEASTELTVRVPNGHTLLIGGYYRTDEINRETKVPILGDLPGIGFFFKTKTKNLEKTSLIFAVTPTTYNAATSLGNNSATDKVRSAATSNDPPLRAIPVEDTYRR